MGEIGQRRVPAASGIAAAIPNSRTTAVKARPRTRGARLSCLHDDGHGASTCLKSIGIWRLGRMACCLEIDAKGAAEAWCRSLPLLGCRRRRLALIGPSGPTEPETRWRLCWEALARFNVDDVSASSTFRSPRASNHHADDEHPSSACATSFSETSARDAPNRLCCLPFATPSPARAILRRKILWERKGAYVILHSRTASSPGIPRLEYQIFPDRAQYVPCLLLCPRATLSLAAPVLRVRCGPWMRCRWPSHALPCAVKAASSKPAATRAHRLHRKNGRMLMCAAVENKVVPLDAEFPAVAWRVKKP
jgi:hypothetical protein